MTSSTAERPLTFVDGPPPAIKRGSPKKGGRTYTDEARQLQDRPGQWAILRSDFPSQASAAALAGFIRIGQLAVFRPSGSFEAVSRTVDGQHRVYARYVGGSDEWSLG